MNVKERNGDLSKAVNEVLGQWKALEIAVDNSFGGVDSREKGEWLKEVMTTFLIQQHNSVCADDVEDYLGTIMDQEFDTIIEDGSLTRVSKELCDVWKRHRGQVTSRRDRVTSRVKEERITSTLPSNPIVKDTDGISHVIKDHDRISHVTKDHDGSSHVTKDPDGISHVTKDHDGSSHVTKDPDGTSHVTKDSDGWIEVKKSKRKTMS